MISAWAKKLRWLIVVLAFVTVLAPGCGDDEEPAPAGTPEAAPGGQAAPASQDAARQAGTHLLQYAPADPLMVALFPSLHSLESEVKGLAARFAPPETDIDAALAEISAQWAEGLGLTGAETPTQVLAAMGIDPAKPIALYVDADEFGQRYIQEVERLKAEADTRKEAADAAEATPEDSSEAAPDATESVEEGESAESTDGTELPEGAEPGMDDTAVDDGFSIGMTDSTIDAMGTAGLPAIAVAFTVSDADKAVAQLDKLLQMSPESAKFAKREVESNGVTMTVYDPKYCSYFVHGDVLFVANEQAWLDQVAAAVQKPGTLPAGLPQGPYDDEQLLMALRTDQMMPLLYAMTLGNSLQPGQAGTMAQMQLATWEETKHFYEGTDPALATLRWNPSEVTLDTRFNLDEHAAMKEVLGAASPMRQAAALPSSTIAVLGLKLTPEMKAGMRKYWIDAIPPEMLQDPSVAGSVMGANQALELIDGEVTLGVTGMENNIPKGLVMLGLSDPQAVIQQFGIFIVMGGGTMPEMPAEPGTILELTFAETMTVYYTVLDKTLMVATSRTELEEAVANLKESKGSGYMASLAPPVDGAAPRYMLLSLQPKLLEVVMALQGGGGDPSMAKIMETIKEIRMTQEMDGPWFSQQMALYLNAP